MSTSDLPFSAIEVDTNLVTGGLLAPGEHISLKEYVPTTALRRMPLRRWHYRVNSKAGVVCHLIVGLRLSEMRTRVEAIAAACPKLTCRPLLFWERKDGMGFLCLEHFEGESLDRWVEQGRCSATQWLEHVRHAQADLQRTSQPSSEAHLIEEVQSLVERVCDFPGFTNLDARILREVAQPAILANASGDAQTCRWTNGDFAGRNLLLNSEGELRLIDYEYAAPTHFGEADWLRLMRFSAIPPGVDENVVSEIKSSRQAGNEILCWLQHLSLLKQVEPTEAVMQHVADTISWLFAAINRATPDSTATSLLIKLAGERQHRMDLLLHESATWAKSLEKQLSFFQGKSGK